MQGAVSERLARIARELDGLSGIEPRYGVLSQELDGARSQVEETARELSRFAASFEADPERLDPELLRRLDVWLAKAYQDDNLFLTLARRPAVLDLFLAWVGFIYAGGSSLEPALVELCRVRLAQRNQCVH